MLLDVEKEKARRRQESTLKQNATVPERSEAGQARDKVGEALGVSGKHAGQANWALVHHRRRPPGCPSAPEKHVMRDGIKLSIPIK